jgi:RNA polymerase sigma factor (sigma-70 family)
MNRGQSDFARVYEENVRSVYGFVAYQVRDRELSEDLTEHTFERALRARSRFDPRRASESTWLLAVARSLLVDHHRRERANRNQPLDERLLPAVEGPESALCVSTELTEALARLSDREREVIALRFGGDLTGPETAEMLGVSVANVQQIVSRSLRKLRGMLEEAEDPLTTGGRGRGPGPVTPV